MSIIVHIIQLLGVNKTMKVLTNTLLLCILIADIISLQAQNSTSQGKLTYQVFENKDKSFGYKILRDGKPMINQESIPAVPGNNGFPKMQQAEKMANLVIQKINQGIMPPTVSVAEVDSIKALVK